MTIDDTDDTEWTDGRVCLECIGDLHLREAMRKLSALTPCSFCDSTDRETVDIEELAPVVAAAFREHYQVVSEDRVHWESVGDDLNHCIQELAHVEPNIAEAIGQWMASYDDEDSRDGGTPRFTGEFTFEPRPIDATGWWAEWDFFVNECRHEARFFSIDLRRSLRTLFGDFQVFGETPIVRIEPGGDLGVMYRGRNVNSEGEARIFAAHPVRDLGPPPAALATAGRMNPGGISVFYGAFSERVAIAELRPSVGGLVVVARFRAIRPLTLLDFRTFRRLSFSDSYFSAGFSERVGKRHFLKSIGEIIAKPVQRHEELIEYVPSQVLAEYLKDKHKLDGLIYPSAQFGSADSGPASAGKDCNVVLFHHASRIQDQAGALEHSRDDRTPSLALDVSSGEWPEHIKLARVRRIHVDIVSQLIIERGDK